MSTEQMAGRRSQEVFNAVDRLTKNQRHSITRGEPMSRRVASIVACAVLVVTTWSPVSAQDGSNPQVASNSSQPYRMTYGQWNARWWQWFFSVPASKNPGLTTDGAVDCSVGQSGDVWFLAGSFQSGGTVSRSCAVPIGKALFVPLINSWADNICNTPQLSVDQLRAAAKSGVIPPGKLHASLDGDSLEPSRAISPVFSYTLPPSPDNVIFASFGVYLPGDCWLSLTVTPAVADGFYVMLTPLTAGLHTIKFGGKGPGITLDVTYTLTIK
jgi:hypothetical protein